MMSQSQTPANSTQMSIEEAVAKQPSPKKPSSKKPSPKQKVRTNCLGIDNLILFSG